MPKHQYPFIRVEYNDRGEFVREIPAIPIRLRNPDHLGEQDVYALLDTGADACVISGDLAKIFNHRLSAKGVRSHFTWGVEGKRCRTYKHTFEIGLLSPSRQRVVWRSGRILIDCVRSEIPPLLGFDCFLKHFRIAIDYPKKQTQIAW